MATDLPELFRRKGAQAAGLKMYFSGKPCPSISTIGTAVGIILLYWGGFFTGGSP